MFLRIDYSTRGRVSPEAWVEWYRWLDDVIPGKFATTVDVIGEGRARLLTFRHTNLRTQPVVWWTDDHGDSEVRIVTRAIYTDRPVPAAMLAAATPMP